ncbi:hypothetical protein GCM10009608_15820 [Pseudonocardia alaniniphila]
MIIAGSYACLTRPADAGRSGPRPAPCNYARSPDRGDCGYQVSARPPGPGVALRIQGRQRLLTLAATHAALLLAQGAGRSLRSMSDKGVAAVLDPRPATTRYGGFLRASLPPFRTTYHPEVVRAALKRLDVAQTP